MTLLHDDAVQIGLITIGMGPSELGMVQSINPIGESDALVLVIDDDGENHRGDRRCPMMSHMWC